MLRVQLPKTAPGTQDDAPSPVIDHQVLGLYGFQTMCAMEKYKTSPPPSKFAVNDELCRQMHPVMEVNYMTHALRIEIALGNLESIFMSTGMSS